MTPVDLKAVMLTALLNPAVIVVAFWMGRSADQWQKLPVAAFAAALAGSVLVYLATWLGIAGVGEVGRAAAGVFTAQFLFGLVWAYLGRRIRAARPVSVLRLWLVGTSVVLAGAGGVGLRAGAGVRGAAHGRSRRRLRRHDRHRARPAGVARAARGLTSVGCVKRQRRRNARARSLLALGQRFA